MGLPIRVDYLYEYNPLPPHLGYPFRQDDSPWRESKIKEADSGWSEWATDKIKHRGFIQVLLLCLVRLAVKANSFYSLSKLSKMSPISTIRYYSMGTYQKLFQSKRFKHFFSIKRSIVYLDVPFYFEYLHSCHDPPHPAPVIVQIYRNHWKANSSVILKTMPI